MNVFASLRGWFTRCFELLEVLFEDWLPMTMIVLFIVVGVGTYIKSLMGG